MSLNEAVTTSLKTLKTVAIRHHKHIAAISKLSCNPTVPGEEEAVDEWITARNAGSNAINAYIKSLPYAEAKAALKEFRAEVASIKRDARKLKTSLDRLTGTRPVKSPVTWTFETIRFIADAGWVSRSDDDEKVDALDVMVPVAHAECEGKHTYFYASRPDVKHLGQPFIWHSDTPLGDTFKSRPMSKFDIIWHASHTMGKVRAENIARPRSEV